MNFNDLVNRSQLVGEARVSPFAKISPAFGGVTKDLQSAGLSSAPYDTIKYIGNILIDLNILTDEEYDSAIRAGKDFKSKQLAMLSLLDQKKEEIVSRGDEVGEAIKNGISQYVKGVSINRVAGRSGGRVDKYEVQKAAIEMKRQAKDLEKQAKSPEAAAAVEVIAAGLDDASKAKVSTAHESTLLQASVARVIRDIRSSLGEEGVDIDEGALEQVEDYIASKITTLEQLKSFIMKIAREPGYELIAAYLADVIKPVKDAISSSKFEDEEYDASKADVDGDGEDEPWEKRRAKARGFMESTTAEYLTEQIKKDRYNKASNEASLSFTEKFKPKTSWQLQELRNYGL